MGCYFQCYRVATINPVATPFPNLFLLTHFVNSPVTVSLVLLLLSQLAVFSLSHSHLSEL